MNILAIESSCDESAVSVMSVDGREVKIFEQLIATHDMSKYQGVVPEQAARQHLYYLPRMLEEVKDYLPKVDIVAATTGPGLMGGLIVGASMGKALAVALKKPFYGVDHIKAHVLSAMIENPELQFPYICLLISGGHTMLVHARDFDNMTVLGRTLDDAMGELFDKVARELGLGFPGGRLIEERARGGTAFKVAIPKHHNILDFSFSGLKTHFIRKIRAVEAGNESELMKATTGPDESLNEDVAKTNYDPEGSDPGEVQAKQALEQSQYSKQSFWSQPHLAPLIADICAGLQDVVARICLQKFKYLFEHYSVDHYAVVGGVASNSYIREALNGFMKTHNKKVFYPSLSLCTDNATMIGFAARHESGLLCKLRSSLDW